MRLLVITHADIAYSPDRCDHELVSGLHDLVDLTIVEWEHMAEPSARAAARVAEMDLSSFDACMVYVRFRLLFPVEPWDWTGFDGLRVWMEHDAWFNYSRAHPTWHGKFPETYRRHGFDLMVATGRHLAELLRLDGVDARWMPKGYSAASFSDLDRARSGVCTFGTMWPSRRAMISRLRHRAVALEDVSGSFSGLNDRLNRHTAAVVCNMPGTVPFGRPGRAVGRIVPSFVRVGPAVEPMIKTFEVAGAGCAPVVDFLEELDELGFVDGDTCLTYRTFDEAADKLLTIDHDELRAIGGAAESLARSRHTWRHRAQQLVELLESA